MRILVIGSGGREHALVWKLAQSQRVKKIYVAPGNPGMESQAELVPIQAEDLKSLLSFAKKEKIDLTIVGPEVSLCDGIVPLFEKEKLPIFGPSKEAALLEGSKIFTKQFLMRHQIPTAAFEVFESIEPARKYVEKSAVPIVVKADGLAAGKGVFVCGTKEEAFQALDFLFVKKGLGEAGRRVVIEDCLQGIETSFMVVASGREAIPLATSKDHKRAYDRDQGPNTGGMGVISPSPHLGLPLQEKVMSEIILPTLAGLEKEGRFFKGILYAGLMLTKEGPFVLEYNVRFGDPETEAILPRLEDDLVDLIESALQGKLLGKLLRWKKEVSVCVMMASEGYPGPYPKGKVIDGLGTVGPEAIVFHAGTARQGDQIITAGGRVLGVTALGRDLAEARKIAYGAVSKISWEGVHYRRDIGL
ncbi:MAG: phosphoribosylamine--glycine ligase [Deltaproteobacteria bacterium]|nr:phosphoribosylamine--glycine ligase [Deltaproteobacteria bacterium]